MVKNSLFKKIGQIRDLLIKHKYIALIAFLVTTFFVVRLVGYLSTEEVLSFEDIHKRDGIPVDVTKVKKERFDVYMSFSGTINGMYQSDLTTNITTRVLEVYKEEGDSVKKNEIILTLDPNDPGRGTSHYRQDKANYLQALREYGRIKELYKVGAVSKQDYEKARTQFEITRANYDASKGMVEIASPIDGTVTDISFDVGEIVLPNKVLATVAVMDEVRIELHLSSSKVHFLKKGQPARIVVDTLSKKVIVEGKVETISLSADDKTGLFKAEVLLDNKDGLLRLGTFMEVEILVYSSPKALVIPKRCLISQDNKNYVFITVDENKVEKRKISIGRENEEEIEVTYGIKEGERVVIKGQKKLVDKALVYIHDEIK